MREKFRLNWFWSTVFLIILFTYVQFIAPSEPIDPWGLFHIKNLGYIFFAISAVQYLSFVLVRWVGGHAGMVLAGFFGGIISSTAVSVASAHLSKDHAHLQRLPAAAVLSASMAMLLEALMILSLSSLELFWHTLPSLLVMILAGVIAIAILFHRGQSHYEIPTPSTPLDLLEICVFTLMLGFLILIVGVGKIYLGDSGVKLLTFAASLFEVHGVIVANAQLYSLGRLETEVAHQVLMIAIMAAFLSKLVIAWWAGAQRFALMVSFGVLAMLLAGMATYAFV